MELGANFKGASGSDGIVAMLLVNLGIRVSFKPAKVRNCYFTVPPAWEKFLFPLAGRLLGQRPSPACLEQDGAMDSCQEPGRALERAGVLCHCHCRAGTGTWGCSSGKSHHSLCQKSQGSIAVSPTEYDSVWTVCRLSRLGFFWQHPCAHFPLSLPSDKTHKIWVRLIIT